MGIKTLDNRPSLEEVEQTFKGARQLAIYGAIALALILIVLWPAIMTSSGVLDLSHFTAWVRQTL